MKNLFVSLMIFTSLASLHAFARGGASGGGGGNGIILIETREDGSTIVTCPEKLPQDCVDKCLQSLDAEDSVRNSLLHDFCQSIEN